MSCKHDSNCPCKSGWCGGDSDKLSANCVDYLVGAYSHLKAQRPRLQIGDVVKHFKNESVDNSTTQFMYKILNFAYDFNEVKQVVYQSLYGPDFKVWVRPYDEFMAEVDKIKHPDVKQKYVYELVVT